MAYTLATVRNRVLTDKLGDTSYDPTVIDGFINDTQRDIFNTYELSFQEKIFRGSLPASAAIFTFPIDYQQSQSMVIAGTNGTKEIDSLYLPFREFNLAYPDPSTSTGPMNRWTIYANRLMFDRLTDEEYTLSLFYLKTADTLEADIDVPEIPEAFQEALVLGAYYRVLQRNEDFDQATYVKQNEYSEQLEKLVARYGKKQTAKAITMRQPVNAAYRRRSRA